MREPDYPGTDQAKWSAVDAYFGDRLAKPDDIFAEVLDRNRQAGMPAHDVSAVQGRFLALLVSMIGAKRVLEVGTLGGYSTIWMARALPEQGRVVTIERHADYAAVAAGNFRMAGVGAKIEQHVGVAADVLPTLAAPFDLVFIDADKPNNPIYLEWALKLARVGTVIVGDNVVRGGAVVDPDTTDPNVQGVRRFIDLLAADSRLDSTALQTVGEKGWDGFSISVVRAA